MACVGATQLYDGPARPIDEVAVLETEYPREIDIFAVDGKKVYGSAWHIAPGRHEVWVKITEIEQAGLTQFTMYATCVFEVDAVAGGAYRIAPDTQVKSGANQKTVDIGAVLIDASGKERGPIDCPGYIPDFE